MSETVEDPGKVEELDALPKNPPQADNALNILGFVLTAVWTGVLGLYAIAAWSKFETLEPNELGDFLAGGFAPLAFLWLVLGFFQQGRELRHSGQALWIQGRELQHSVKQQRELVKATREQLKFETNVLQAQQLEIARNSRPVLKLIAGREDPATPQTRNQVFHVLNHGKRCTNLVVAAEGYDSQVDSDILETGSRYEFSIEIDTGDFAPMDVLLTFLDERMIPGSAAFLVSRQDGKLIIVDKPAEMKPEPKARE